MLLFSAQHPPLILIPLTQHGHCFKGIEEGREQEKQEEEDMQSISPTSILYSFL
jgi:hypothetical protein